MPTSCADAGEPAGGMNVLSEKGINRGLALIQLDLTLRTCVFCTVYRTLFVYPEPSSQLRILRCASKCVDSGRSQDATAGRQGCRPQVTDSQPWPE